ncbi:hypothetical protein LguiA_001061 [Lonicera macranthoides]
MSNNREEPSCSNPGGGKFHTVQPLRDQESNWAVDLAKNLEEYLLKICSGDTTADVDSHLSVNFAEAALLLQGSIQVYSRKVEYLYSLVLHALEFISQKSQHDQPESASAQPEEGGSHALPAEKDNPFWGLDDITVEAKNSLDGTTSRDAPLNHFVKPPANLVVLEGDCLDAIGDGGELESYLLATNDLYRDFILLDSCDAVAVDDFLNGDDKASKWQNGVCRGSSLTSKSRKSFLSPTRRSGGISHKLSAVKSQNADLNQSPWVDNGCNIPENNHNEFEMDDGYSEPRDFNDSEDDDDDPWKPLNPHEPGNLKVKPFKKVKAFRQEVVNPCKRLPIITEFPLAKLHGTISSELTKIWEMQKGTSAKLQESRALPLYEKLRQSLVHGVQENGDAFTKSVDDNVDNGYDSGDPDSGPPNFDMPENAYMNEGPLQPEKHDDGDAHLDTNETYGHEDPNFQASLEDLCRSHLDSLLASIAESEKQTELATRVSTWKQRIEHNLEEQDSHPPFDIHEYGERVLDKLSVEADTRNAMSFADVVQGQQKHDVARTFSALLQLVNNGNVDLERGGGGNNDEPPCYTAVNPFYVRLIRHAKRREEVQLRSSKKRIKSPIAKGHIKGDRDKRGKENCPAVNSPTSGLLSTSILLKKNCKMSVKLRKAGGFRCSPEGKRRRRSGFVEPGDLQHSAG